MKIPLSERHKVDGQVCVVFSGKMTNFCKNEDCPSSDKLLDFQSHKFSKTTTDKIRRHLARCEFCAAEADFYSRYPLDETQEATTTTVIPAPLFELAEALLKNRHFDSTSLNSLLKNKKPVAR